MEPGLIIGRLQRGRNRGPRPAQRLPEPGLPSAVIRELSGALADRNRVQRAYLDSSETNVFDREAAGSSQKPCRESTALAHPRGPKVHRYPAARVPDPRPRVRHRPLRRSGSSVQSRIGEMWSLPPRRLSSSRCSTDGSTPGVGSCFRSGETSAASSPRGAGPIFLEKPNGSARNRGRCHLLRPTSSIGG